MRIEKRKHIVNAYDKAYYGRYPIGDNIDFGEIQGQNCEEGGRGQAEGRSGVVVEEMQGVQIQLASLGKRTPIGKQRKNNHPNVFPMEVSEIEVVFRVQSLANPDVCHQKEHHKIDGDNAESVLLCDLEGQIQ